MKMIRLLIIPLLIIQACSGSGTKEKNIPAIKDSAVAAADHFETGKIISVTEKNSPAESYSLYLPSSYSPSKLYPVMFIFDAHGDGSLPLKNYSELAEKYNYVLAGSNNSKNGQQWNESQSIANNLFNDVRSRLSIDQQRIYLLGFSGGARVANALAISNGFVNGVICCGAAAPASNETAPRENYNFLSIAGLNDFNYTELRKYDLVDLAGYKIKHYQLTFDGKHEWPPLDVMNDAFWWMELNNMRKNPATKNDSLIRKNLEPLQNKYLSLKQKNDPYALYSLTRKIINYYEGLTDLSDYLATWKSLQSNAAVDKELKKEEELWKKEDELKAFYVKAFQSQDQSWWKKEVASLNQKMKSAPEDESHMYHRILDYLSLVCYMQTTGAMKQNNVNAAEYFSEMYLLIDPSNAEASFLAAELAAERNDNSKALELLKISVKNGFQEAERMRTDPAFARLQAEPAFQDLMRSISTK